jgi:pSer/pThr/pTyr-binding forkhead associated (FHA) protein/DNA-directed RNA polymerase subunit RPC12/RpoP
MIATSLSRHELVSKRAPRVAERKGAKQKGEGRMESLVSGTLAGAGSFRCRRCGYVLTLVASDTLPDCPSCSGRDFVRASLFSAGRIAARRSPFARRSDTQPAFAAAPETHSGLLAQSDPGDHAAWLARIRERIEQPGEYLVYEEGGELRMVPLTREWTRIGRSLAADVRFDDPTVSRRHALIVRQADGVRVLDDRSLNGVFVNGTRVDRAEGQRALKDGDEIVVGRYRLSFLSIAPRPDLVGPEDTPLRTVG